MLLTAGGAAVQVGAQAWNSRVRVGPGELELDVKDNPTAAVTHFQNSLDVMPGARPQVSEQLLPRAQARALEKAPTALPAGSAGSNGTPKRKDPR